MSNAKSPGIASEAQNPTKTPEIIPKNPELKGHAIDPSLLLARAALKLHRPSLSQAERPQSFPIHGQLFEARLLVELLKALQEWEVPGLLIGSVYIQIDTYYSYMYVYIYIYIYIEREREREMGFRNRASVCVEGV